MLSGCAPLPVTIGKVKRLTKQESIKGLWVMNYLWPHYPRFRWLHRRDASVYHMICQQPKSRWRSPPFWWAGAPRPPGSPRCPSDRPPETKPDTSANCFATKGVFPQRFFRVLGSLREPSEVPGQQVVFPQGHSEAPRSLLGVPGTRQVGDR